MSEKFKKTGYFVASFLTRQYLKSLKEWTQEPQEAHVFQEKEAAIHACETWAYFQLAQI